MRHLTGLLLSLGLVVVVACSPSIEKPEYDACSGKKKAACAAAASAPGNDVPAATTPYQAPLPAAPAAPVDAGAPLRKADGGRPTIPPPNFACRDLSRCCRAIKSSFERAACVAVVYKAKPSVCSTALIGYQVFGCGHQPFDIGGILPGNLGAGYDNDSDGVPDFVDDNAPPPYTLNDYCAEYPEACNGTGAAEYDTGAGWGDLGPSPTPYDPGYIDFGGPPVDPSNTPDPFGTPDPSGTPDPFGTPDPSGSPDPGDSSDNGSGDFGDWWW